MATCEGNHVSKRIRQACEGGKALIEIKRNCSSSVKEDPDNEKIIFGDFTIRFTDEEYHIFEAFIDLTEQPPVEALEDFLLSALEHFKTVVLEPKVVY